MKDKINIVGIMHFGGDIDEKYMYFDRLKQVTDKTVAFIDNLKIDVDADYVIRTKTDNLPWNDNANRLMSLTAAAHMEADWILSLDSDEDIDHRIKNRDDLEEIIRYLERAGCNSMWFALREMWGSDHTYRADGIWGIKKRLRLNKNLLKDERTSIKPKINQKYHSIVFDYPGISKVSGPPVYEIYHYGCITEEKRQQRVAKYKKLDPNNDFQKMGYDYMLDHKGIEIKKVQGKKIQ